MRLGLHLTNPSGESRLIAIDLETIGINADEFELDDEATTELEEPLLVTHIRMEILPSNAKESE